MPGIGMRNFGKMIRKENHYREIYENDDDGF